MKYIYIFLFVNLLIYHTKQFLDGCLSPHCFQNPIFTHKHKILCAPLSQNISRTSSISDECSDFIGKIQHFKNTHTSFESCVSTVFTPLSMMKSESIFFRFGNRLDSDVLHHPLDDIIFFLGRFI